MVRMTRGKRLRLAPLAVVLAGVFTGAASGEARAVPATRLVQGKAVPTGNDTYPALGEFAGTPLAMRLQKSIDKGTQEGVPQGTIVEGPSAFSDEVRNPPPRFIARIIHKAYIWTKWQLASSWDDKIRLRGPPTHFSNPLLVPDQLLSLLETAGDDGRPLLLPGDIIVNGIGGIATHVSLYVGKDPESGKPEIVHALGTPATQQSYVQLVGNVMKSLVRTVGKIGVVREGLGDFIARFQRDTYFIVRDPRMSDEMRARGVARGREIEGLGYDYDINQSNDSLYCTEVVTEMLKAAYEGSGLPLPWVGTTAVHRRSLEEFPITPDNILASPDFQVIHASETGWKHLEHVIRTHVVGAAAE